MSKVGFLGLVLAAPLLMAQEIPRTPIEADALDPANISPLQVQAAANLIRLSGYRCDSISSARGWLYSRGITMVCNRFRYEYEIEDKGGRWVVTVK